MPRVPNAIAVSDRVPNAIAVSGGRTGGRRYCFIYNISINNRKGTEGSK